MAQNWYWFIFADGYRTCVRGMNKAELAAEVRKHGKLCFKEKA